MPVRATKRGVERTPLSGDVRRAHLRRELRRARGRARARAAAARGVLMIDRYEIGERQTSACAAPTAVARAPRPGWTSIQQTFGDLVVHAPAAHAALAAAVDVLDVRLPPRCARCCATQCDARTFETAKVDGAHRRHVVHTDRGDLTRAARSSTRSAGGASSARGANVQPPDARLSRGLEVHPHARRRRPRAVARPDATSRAGYSWSLPGRRRAARRRRLVRPARPRQGADACALAADVGVARRALAGQLDPAPAAPGRRGRRLLRRRQRRPLPADDRRGHPPRVLLRARAAAASCATSSRAARRASRRSRATARSRDDHRWPFRWLLRVQDARRRASTRRALLTPALRRDDHPALRRLGLRALPGHRAARVRARGPGGGR